MYNLLNGGCFSNEAPLSYLLTEVTVYARDIEKITLYSNVLLESICRERTQARIQGGGVHLGHVRPPLEPNAQRKNLR